MDAKFRVGDRVKIVRYGRDADSEYNGLEGIVGKGKTISGLIGVLLDPPFSEEVLLCIEPELEMVTPAAASPEDSEVAMKFDSGKPRVSLIPSIAIEMEGAVLGFGENKYESHNWRKGMKWSKLIDSAIRHLLKLKEGEDIDPESGLPHWAHVRCNMGFLGEYQHYGLGDDDRFIQPKDSE